MKCAAWVTMLRNHTWFTGGLQKNGVHKMIFQSAWKENGFVAGLCEISMIIPAELPHHIRG